MVVAGGDGVDGRVVTDDWAMVVLTVFVTDGTGTVDGEVDRAGGGSEVATVGNTAMVDIDGVVLVLEVVVMGVEGSTKVEGGINEEGAEVLPLVGGTDCWGEEKVVVAAGLTQAAYNELVTRPATSAKVTRCFFNRISSPGPKNLSSPVNNQEFYRISKKRETSLYLYSGQQIGSANTILLHLSRGRRTGVRTFVFLPLVLFNRLPQDQLYLAVDTAQFIRSPCVQPVPQFFIDTE